MKEQLIVIIVTKQVRKVLIHMLVYMYENHVLERGNDVHAYAHIILHTQVERIARTYEYPAENAWVALVWYHPKLRFRFD